MGEGNILFNQSKDSVSTENNGGYKKIVVSPSKPRQLGFFAEGCTECAPRGQGAVITHGIVEEWCLCVPSHDRPVLRRPAKTASRTVLLVPWLMSAARPQGLQLAELFPDYLRKLKT